MTKIIIICSKNPKTRDFKNKILFTELSSHETYSDIKMLFLINQYNFAYINNMLLKL